MVMMDARRSPLLQVWGFGVVALVWRLVVQVSVFVCKLGVQVAGCRCLTCAMLCAVDIRASGFGLRVSFFS